MDKLTGHNWELLICDVREGLRSLADESIHCVVCSPPYWSLRDYGIDGQLGLEKTPAEYVANMVEVFREVRRVLRCNGTLWLNMGDSYTSGGRSTHGTITGKQKSNVGCLTVREQRPELPVGLKPKDLIGTPWQLAFALRDDGWYLRSDIIWSKPNPMPESVTDRPTKSHEYIFLLTKSPRYFWDAEAVKEAGSPNTHSRGRAGKGPNEAEILYKSQEPGLGNRNNVDFQRYMADRPVGTSRNIRSVWTIPTQPFPEAHFATYPEKLVEPCIKAGTSEKGCCPYCGAPWRRVVDSVRRPTRPGRNNCSDETGKANRDEQRHVTETKTVGWKPGCDCYGLEVIEDQPSKPSKPELIAAWEAEIIRWRERWESLKPLYDDCETEPCVVCDPFLGSGTTLKVAVELGRKGIGIELSPKYAEMARLRILNYKKHAAPGQKTIAPLPDQMELFG